MSESLGIVLLLLIVERASAQNAARRVRNIVLVDGAWADGLAGRRLRHSRQGWLQCQHVEEPETSFEDDVAATKRVLALQDGPCILSLIATGSVITEAGTHHRLSVWCTLRPTCRMLERVRLKRSGSRVT